MSKRFSAGLSAGLLGGLAAALTLAACMVESKSSYKEPSPQDLAVVDAILKENGHDEKVMQYGCSFCLSDPLTGRIRRIDFGVYRLKSLPTGLETLAGLEELILDEAVVGGFPESLCGATSLRKLSWKQGEMRSLPACIGNLSRLEYLNLSGNSIMNLPDAFGNLDSLVTLDLGGNQSGVLAPVLSGCFSLSVLRINSLFLNGTLPALVAELPRLRVLDVSRNGFTAVPEVIWSCPRLREVSLNGNRITHIPQALMSMATLKVFSINDNPLCSVTPAEAEWLSSMDPDWRKKRTAIPYGRIPFNGPGRRIERGVSGLVTEVFPMIRSALFAGGLVSTLALGLGFQNGLCYEKTEQPEGWASQSGGTTGGAGGTEVIVSTMTQLQTEAKSSGKKIIIVNKGTYTGEVVLASDKSILGKEPGVIIKGSIHVSKVNNVIIRNLAIKGDPCNTYDECKGGEDAMSVNSEAHHVWLDHLDISDGQDGNCDITNGSDFVTVTWSKFWYSYDKEHRFSNLIASDDNVAIDKGKLSITYAYCWWADRVVERQPRGRAGKVHVLNNLYTSSATNYICGPGVDIQMLIENNAMKSSGTAIKPFDGSPAPAWKSVGNIGTASNMATNQGTVFTPPYTMTLKMAAADVDGKVRPAAGNTLTLATGTTGIAGTMRTDGKGSIAYSASKNRNPFVSASPEGWRLHNPGAAPLRYELLDANGRRRDPQAVVKAGQSALLPGGTAWKVRFMGSELAPIQLPH